MKCAARGSLKYRTRTIAQLSRALSSQLRHVSTIEKNLLNGNMMGHCHGSAKTYPTFSQYAELRPINGWDLLASLGHRRKFQQVSRLGFATAPMSLNRRQPNFAWCLAVSCACILYIHFRGALAPLRIFCQLQNSLCVQIVLLYWQCYCTTLEHW